MTPGRHCPDGSVHDPGRFPGLIFFPSPIITAVIGFFIVRMTWRAAKTVPEQVIFEEANR